MEKSSKFEGQYIYLEELELYDCDSEGPFLKGTLTLTLLLQFSPGDTRDLFRQTQWLEKEGPGHSE